MTLRIGCLTVDARDCQRLAGFWSQALGWTIVESTDAGVYLVPSGPVGKDVAVPGLLGVSQSSRQARQEQRADSSGRRNTSMMEVYRDGNW